MPSPAFPPQSHRSWRGLVRLAMLGLLVWGPAQTALAEARTVRVGMYQNPPKIFRDRGGKSAGILVELLGEIAARERWSLEYVDCAWQECLDALAAGRLDLLPDVAYTEERGARFSFHRVPALHSWSELYRRRDVHLSSVIDLAGKRVAVLGGSMQEQGLRALLQGFDFSFEVVPAASQGSAFALVAEGRADVAVANYRFGAYQAEAYGLAETPIVFLPVRLYYAAPKNANADLLAAIDHSLDAWENDPGSPYFRILHVWGDGAPRTVVPEGLRQALFASLLVALALTAGVFWLRRKVRLKTAALVRSNAQLEATLDAIPDLLFEVDRDGRYLDVHTRRKDLLAAPAESLLGRTISEILPAAAAEVCMQALREADENGWSGGQQLLLDLPSGVARFEISVAKQTPPDPAGPRFLMLSRDVTDRWRAEASLKRMTRLYAALSQCNQAIVRCKDEHELLQSICRDAVDYGDMKMAWIGLLDPAGDVVRPVAFHGAGTEYLQELYIALRSDEETATGPTGTSIREDRPVWCQDYAGDPLTAPWRARAAKYGWAAAAALPLHRGSQVVGCLNLYAGEPGAFDDAARSLLTEMALDIEFALERFSQDAERARMAETIRESEEKYRELTESINDVIWTLDTRTHELLYVSPAVFRLCGERPADLTGRTVDDFLPEDAVARLRARLAADIEDFRNGRRGSADDRTVEFPFTTREGTTVWLEVLGNLVSNRRTAEIELHGVARDITERKNAEARIERLAHYDHLTGLPNRSLLKERFSYALGIAQRSGSPLAVMFLDLDHFKDINDTLGHDTGDQLLVELGRRLETSLRGGDTVCRLGGDEFILVLPDTDAAGAGEVASKLLELVSRPYRIGSRELDATPSIGIAIYPEDGEDMDTLSRNADVAMYQAKRDSRNAFRFFTQAMQERSVRMLEVTGELRHALERGQFSLHYQPQLALPAGRLVGAEALLRWQHPVLGMVSPAEFIPIAESNGQILPIGEWVLREAIAQARRWMDEGLPHLVIAVNLSAAQFRNPALPELVAQLLAAAGLPPDRLELELTEAVAMGNPRLVAGIMEGFARQGIRIAIDDFGTGYSSLSYLKRFRVHKLKIDQSFVRDIATDPEDRAIVTTVIRLAHSLGMGTVAEGVETSEQLAFLRDNGCNGVQGYYFSKPLTSADFAAYVWHGAGAARVGDVAIDGVGL